MALHAQVIAIGPFAPELATALDYPPDFYRNTRVGTPVLAVLFGIVEGTNAGVRFAECLGITDPWDFNQHKIDLHTIDIDELKSLIATFADPGDYAKDLTRLELLRTAGFDMYFVPNG